MDATREDPTEVRERYTRKFQSIQVNKRGIKVAQSIWTWITLARRPLTLEELRSAVELDLKSKLLDLKKTLSEICGDLVTIHPEDRVNVKNEIVREILLDRKVNSEFPVDEAHGHTRIAVTLLNLLSDSTLRRIPMNASVDPAFMASCDSSLVDYAATFFAEHVSFCPPAEDSVMKGLCAFLGFNVYFWREYVAKNGNQGVITQTAHHLRHYAARRAEVVPTDDSICIIKEWANKQVA